jgi:hypothetical protein
VLREFRKVLECGGFAPLWHTQQKQTNGTTPGVLSRTEFQSGAAAHALHDAVATLHAPHE